MWFLFAYFIWRYLGILEELPLDANNWVGLAEQTQHHLTPSLRWRFLMYAV